MEDVISPNSDERGIVIGQTGSGKTFFMHYLLEDVKRLVVLDPKGTLSGPNASGGDWHLEPWNSRARKAFRRGVSYRARIPAPLDGNWDGYLWEIYRAGNLMLYVDETYGVVPPGKRIPQSLNAIYTRGRELGIGAWSASQRPSWIPLEIMSEAQWYVMFRTMLEEDRRRMAAFMGPDVIREIPDPFGFWIRHVSWHRPEYFAGLEVENAA